MTTEQWEIFWMKLLDSAADLDVEFAFQDWLENKKIDFERER